MYLFYSTYRPACQTILVGVCVDNFHVARLLGTEQKNGSQFLAKNHGQSITIRVSYLFWLINSAKR